MAIRCFVTGYQALYLLLAIAAGVAINYLIWVGRYQDAFCAFLMWGGTQWVLGANHPVFRQE